MNLQPFEFYLREEALKESSISEHLKNIERFAVWANENHFESIEYINYKELLGYVQHLRGRGVITSTINIRLNSIRKYYGHLKQEGAIQNNPAKRLHIKGAIKKITYNPFLWNELENLYHSYVNYLDTQPIREQKQHAVRLKKKAVLGIIIAQALHSGELEKIEVEQVNLKSGTLYIQGTARSQNRELKLDTWQILPLHEYVNSLPAAQTKLLVCSVPNFVQSIINELKGINQSVQNAQHIRASVILHWLRMYGKRQTQYMIGHKWISSTEHYEVQEIQGLTDLLKKHHPFS